MDENNKVEREPEPCPKCGAEMVPMGIDGLRCPICGTKQ